MRSRSLTVFSFFRLSVLIFMASAMAFGQPIKVTWYASHDLSQSGATATIPLNNDQTEMQLKGGWICQIAAVSKQLVYSARQVACSKNNETFEFSVQCESSSPKEHIQIRLKDGDDRIVDFIEVGCETVAQ